MYGIARLHGAVRPPAVAPSAYLVEIPAERGNAGFDDDTEFVSRLALILDGSDARNTV